MEYAGESIAKKVARVRLYRRTKKMLAAYGHDMNQLCALVLAGPDGTEVGCLKHILNVRPENVIAIDRDKVCCDNFEKKFPGSKVLNADLEDADTSWECMKYFDKKGCHFVHLDLMGTLTKNTKVIYAAFGQVAIEGTIVATTFLRGRETGAQREMLHQMKEFEKVAKQYRVGKRARIYTKLSSPDPERSEMHAATLSLMANDLWSRRYQTHVEGKKEDEVESFLGAVLEDPSLMWELDTMFMPISAYAYTGEVSPMGVVVSQLTPKAVRENEDSLWWKELSNLSRDASCIIKRDSMAELLQEADSLEKSFSKQQVAEILDVSVGTLAAWRAHCTMGTYD